MKTHLRIAWKTFKELAFDYFEGFNFFFFYHIGFPFSLHFCNQQFQV
mgnify:FL=1